MKAKRKRRGSWGEQG